MRSAGQDVRTVGRIVRGSVSGAGAITGGSGFTVTRTGAGRYTIVFLVPYPAVPYVAITINDGIGAYTFSELYSTTGFRVDFNTAAPAQIDAGFNFIAIGVAP